MKNVISVKKLKQNTQENIKKFIIWETIVDFTKVEKGGVKIDEILFRL